MTVAEILNQVEAAQGTNTKLKILRENKDNQELRRALELGLDSYKQFGTKKVDPIDRSNWEHHPPVDTDDDWRQFFEVAEACASRSLVGNAARKALTEVFQRTTVDAEKWMRRVILKHFAIGASRKTVEKAFGEKVVETFSVQLAGKYNLGSHSELPPEVVLQPKLDGVRCIAVVDDRGGCQLFARSGKPLSNFDSTIGQELAQLPPAAYDGEIMGKGFQSLMRQVHRKFNVDVSDSFMAIFDCIPLDEWNGRQATTPYDDRRGMLEDLAEKIGQTKYLALVTQDRVANDPAAFKACHDKYVAEGYEGAMIKRPQAPYNFGRGDAILKFKSFNDVDLRVVGFKEGSGKNRGTLGAIVVDFEGVRVSVGSGFEDDIRQDVWQNQDKYLGATAEIRYQEVTDDGSLRFPTFVGWRTDK